jgi:hypothetical protein
MFCLNCLDEEGISISSPASIEAKKDKFVKAARLDSLPGRTGIAG